MHKFTRSLIFLFFIIHLAQGTLYAQKQNILLHPDKFYKKFFPNLKLKKGTIPDTSYIKTYPKLLCVGVHLLSPTIFLDINSKSDKEDVKTASSNFRTNVSNIIGFSGSYKFVTVGFSLLLKSNNHDKNDYTSSFYHTATIKYNSLKYYLQFKYIKTKGYTDKNELNQLDSNLKYINRSDLQVKEYQFEGLYNFQWKKYSYMAPIDFTQRQIKSHAGFLLKGGIYYNEISADSVILSARQQFYYEGFNNIQKIQSNSIKLSAGAGGNLIFLRKFYFSLAVFTPFNLYFSKFITTDGQIIKNKTSLLMVVDGVAGIGFQSKRCYAGIRYQLDTKRVNLNRISVNTFSNYISFNLGYRFVAPGIVKKVYKKTMPPEK